MKLCELCNSPANIYCPSDSALLCWNCDAKVHAANFLVARHLRSIICSNCTLAFPTSTFSGHKYHYHYHNYSLCDSCLEQDSSDCISSTDQDQSSSCKHNSSFNNKNVNEVSSKCNTTRSSVEWKAEAILVNWGNKLGIRNRRNVVEVACHAFGMCNSMKLTYRVGLAASLWLSLRLVEGSESEQRLQLKRLEEICGVPSKVIVAAHSKLARIHIKMNKQGQQQQQQHAEEGWAESCS